jgi:hypothetical protein
MVGVVVDAVIAGAGLTVAVTIDREETQGML